SDRRSRSAAGRIPASQSASDAGPAEQHAGRRRQRGAALVEHGYFVDVIPTPFVFALSVLISLLSVEFGYRLGQRTQRTAPETDPPVGGSVGATLGLLAFTLAFTFSMSASRYDARGQLVLAEADAVRTAYLQAVLLGDPE